MTWRADSFKLGATAITVDQKAGLFIYSTLCPFFIKKIPSGRFL